MTVLDGLREGGRMVGIVSHVAELKQRIPAQIRVHKSQAGSHLTQYTGALSRATRQRPVTRPAGGPGKAADASRQGTSSRFTIGNCQSRNGKL
jgi:hypothetical protein